MAFPMLMCYNVNSVWNEGACVMAIENGEWVMRGLRWDDPYRIRSWQELID